MSLAHAILGLLNQAALTGYELKTQKFDASIAHFWAADQAQIYRTLEKLQAQGYVTNQLEVQENRPNRKVYSITAAGKAELDRWLHEIQPIITYREPFLVQLYFAEGLTNAELVAQFHAQRTAHAARLQQFQDIAHYGFPPLTQLTEQRGVAFQRMTLELGLRLEQAYLAWIDAMLEYLANLPPENP
jgi:DNA-binding PadR family transcriptional regulator